MYNFIIKEQSEQLKVIESIMYLENKYSIVFPDELKMFYLKCKEGKIKICVFIVDGVECEVASIVSVITEGYNFEKITDNNKIDAFLPDSFYPLASDRGGNYYYWDSVDGKVYLSFSDDIENPFLISDSIKEFFDILDDSIST